MRCSNRIMSVVVLFLLIAISPPASNAQDMEKTVIITKKWGGAENSRIVAYVLSVTESYNDDMTVDNYSFLFSAQNDKYETFQDLFPIVGGSAQDVFNFTEWVIKFIEVCKVEDVKIPIEDSQLPLTIEYVNWNLMGKKYFISNGSAYHRFKKSEFEKIQKELLKYCKRQGIEIDTSIKIEINPSLGNKK